MSGLHFNTKKESDQKILIIIPCYNEEKSITRTTNSVKRILQKYSWKNAKILIINDGSIDQSIEEIKALKVPYLDLPINIGIGAAMQSGFIYAQKNDFDIAIQVDGDGQHPAEYIYELITPVLNQKADVVIGSRYINKQGFQSSLSRQYGIRFFSLLINLLNNTKILDTTSGFRAYNKKAIAIAAKHYPETYPEPEAIVLFTKHQLALREVAVQMLDRKHGVSSIGISKSFLYMFLVTLNILFNYFKSYDTEH